MKEKIKVIFIAVIFLIIGTIIGFFLTNFLKNNSISVVDQTSKCLGIFEKKKDKYISPNNVRQDIIFNEKLNTCLIFIQNFRQEETEMVVVDMLKDKTLLFYSDEQKGLSTDSERCENSSLFLMYFENGKKVVKEGCEKWELTDEMREKINSFGFSFS